jgi:hypothetical protein
MMAEGYDDAVDLDALSDEEIYDRILEHLREGGIDPDDLDIDVRDGAATVGGRLGSEADVRVVAHILTDQVGLPEFENEIVIDPLATSETSEDTLEAAEDQDVEDEDSRLGEADDSRSDTASHVGGNVERDTFGTRDPSAAVEDGAAYTPPDRPTPEGREGS